MTQITVEYFAVLREHAGRDREALSTAAVTAGELFEELNARYQFPDTGPLKVAINAEFREWTSEISDGDSVVFIPPVAGG